MRKDIVEETGFVVQGALDTILIETTLMTRLLSEKLSRGISQPVQTVGMTAALSAGVDKINEAEKALARGRYDILARNYKQLSKSIKAMRRSLNALWRTSDPVEYTILAAKFAADMNDVAIEAQEMNTVRGMHTNMKR